MWAAACTARSGEREQGACAWRDVSVEDLIRTVQALPPVASACEAVRPGLQYLDSRAYAALLKGLAKTGLAQRATELFDEIRHLEPTHELAHLADVYTYTTAISQCSSHHQLRRALELVAEMRSRSVALNVHTYSALLNVCLKCNELDLALDIYQQMLSEGVNPNLVTYNTLLDVYAKTGHYADALAVMDQLDAQRITPEPRTYNTIVAACNMSGHYSEAFGVYERMLSKGLEPMPATYNAIVCALARLGRLPAALSLLRAVAAKGVERTVPTYAALLSACEQSGRWDLALELLQRMQEEGLKPTTACFNSAIAACVKGGQPHHAEQLFERLYSVCKPDATTFNALAGIYCKLGKACEALGVLEVMQRGGQHADAGTHASLVEATWSSGALPMQRFALMLLEQAGLAPEAPLPKPEGPDEGAGAGASSRGSSRRTSLDERRAPAWSLADGTAVLRLRGAPPHVTMLSLLRTLKALRRRAEDGAALELSLGPMVHVAIELQEEHAAPTIHVVMGVLCAIGSPLQPVGPLANPPAPAAEAAASAPGAAAALRDGGSPAPAAAPEGAASPTPAAPAEPQAQPDAGGALTLDLACSGAAFARWVAGPSMGAPLSQLLLEDTPMHASSAGPGASASSASAGFPLLIPASAAAGGRAASRQVLFQRLPDAQLLAKEDGALEARCKMVMAAVQRSEAMFAIDVQNLPPEVMVQRSDLVQLLISAAPLLGLGPECGHDAALLLDRAAASGAFSPASWASPGAGRLLGAACLALCAGRGAAVDMGALEAAFGVPAAAVLVAVDQVCLALGGGGGGAPAPAPQSPVSALRVLRLYLERLGHSSQLPQPGASAAAAGAAPPAWGRRALVASEAAAAAPAFAGCPPSLAAMALLAAARLAAGAFPLWPAALRGLTGYSFDEELLAPLVRRALEVVVASDASE